MKYLIALTFPGGSTLQFYCGTEGKVCRFDNVRARATSYRNKSITISQARRLATSFPAYKFAVISSDAAPAAVYRAFGKHPNPLRVVKKNPIAPDRADLARAAKLRKDFSGHEATRVTHRKIQTPRVGLTVGPVLGIMYATVRDGKAEKYLHRFRKSSRPLLAASSDGKTLIIVGGRYQFTDRGIVDK